MRRIIKPWKQNTFIFAVVLTILVIAGRLAAYPAPVRDIIHGSFVEGLTLQYPAVYTILAPVFQLADRLTL